MNPDNNSDRLDDTNQDFEELLQQKDAELRRKDLQIERLLNDIRHLKSDSIQKELIIQEYQSHQKKVSFVLLRAVHPITKWWIRIKNARNKMP